MHRSSDVIHCFTILPIEMSGMCMIHLTSALFPGSGLKIKLVHGGAYQIQEVGRSDSWFVASSQMPTLSW